jgi:hypothetical protein
MRSDDDADIDAMMRSTLGNTGEIVPFPIERARKSRERPAREPKPEPDPIATQIVADLSTKLTAELAANESPAPAPEERKFIDPRTIPVRFSSLKHIARSALHYLDAVQLDRDDTLAMRIGRGGHALTLGMPAIKWTGGKSGKAPRNPKNKEWQKFQKQHADKEILSESEWAKAEGIANAIRRHPIASELLFTGDTVLEQQIVWEYLGRKCTSRPDARRGSEFVADLKTTQCAEPEKFKRDALWRGYNAQLAFYAAAAEYLTGVHINDLYVIAVESKRPFAITVLRLDDEARIAGERLYRGWFERLLVCEASNYWPAYTDSIVAFGSELSGGTPDNPIDLDQLDDDDQLWA